MNKKKVDKVKIYVILIEEPNISDFGRGPSMILKTDFEKTLLPKKFKPHKKVDCA